MGFLEWLLGGDAPSDRQLLEARPDWSEEDGWETASIHYFLDENPGDRDDLLDYQLIVVDDPMKEACEILRCNQDLHIPRGTKIYPLYRGELVQWFDGQPYMACTAGLIHPEQVEEAGDEYDLMDLPTGLEGLEIPERSPWSDEDLERVCLSFDAGPESPD